MNKIKNKYLFIFLALIIISLLIFTKKMYSSTEDYDQDNLSLLLPKSQSELKTGYKVQINVLNGCGTKGIADLYTNFLRNQGYDVIDYGNASHFEYNETKLIIHNKNHKEFIYEIVDLLKINPQHLEYNYNKNIFYDLTLIVGSDYNNLPSYDEVSLHYEPF
tara:strand:+ start:70 stop:555 length:486 start_codon:yes stop_codon:yes gene_type:complete